MTTNLAKDCWHEWPKELPPKNGEYLVVFLADSDWEPPTIERAFFRKGNGEIVWIRDEKPCGVSITHWRPLPTLPVEAKL